MKTFPEISENIDNNTTINAFSHKNNSNDNDIMRSNDEGANVLKLLDIFKTLTNTSITVAFPNVYLAYKGICTLPPTTASAERCFSKLKLIKTNLRSTISESKLDHLMLISCNADIDIPKY
ncbi:Ribonuclease H-like domain,HAT, C-terminal dimerisation domain [Cinara cedri]|uniref:Ribonuclease H-like domain,HAT, C-terminal dimerisation domain n=1 Tax=Cinara cedri TaxID=506608 RepID=A0A5E4MQS2_9HEMI|nr:Ribonuclease H-like domain,HAT, C-terminal dimerisation domain [Cinara cedri]